MLVNILGAFFTVIAVGAFLLCLWLEYGPRHEKDEDEIIYDDTDREEKGDC